MTFCEAYSTLATVFNQGGNLKREGPKIVDFPSRRQRQLRKLRHKLLLNGFFEKSDLTKGFFWGAVVAEVSFNYMMLDYQGNDANQTAVVAILLGFGLGAVYRYRLRLSLTTALFFFLWLIPVSFAEDIFEVDIKAGLWSAMMLIVVWPLGRLAYWMISRNEEADEDDDFA